MADTTMDTSDVRSMLSTVSDFINNAIASLQANGGDAAAQNLQRCLPR